MLVIRYIAVGGVAWMVTFGLFFSMHFLIRLSADEDIEDVPPNKIIDFVRLKRKPENVVKEKKLPQKVKREKEPPMQQLKLNSSSASANALAINLHAPKVAAPEFDMKMVGGPTLGGAPSDTDVVPTVRVQPMYPPSAARSRIEGWVQLVFSITKTGSVTNPRVVSAKPPRIFDQAALQAIRKWKYKPKVQDGKRVETKGVRVRLKFKLDNE